MIKLKYNFLVIIQIIFSLLNTVLLVRLFKVSAESDAWLLAISIIAVLQILLIMPVFQFMPFYNAYKSQSIKKAHDFYSFWLIFAVIFGILLCLLFQFSLDWIIKIFTMKIDPVRFSLLKNILSVSTLGLAFYPLINLNEALFNAEMKFSVPYIFNIFPNFFIVSAELYLLKTNSQDIYVLACGQVAAWLLSAVIGSILIAKYIIKPKFIFSFANFKEFLMNSVTMKFGDSIYHITMPTILNNFLVAMPQGYVSYFYYARKIIEIVNSVSTGPSAKIINSKISKIFPKGKVAEIKDYKNTFIKFLIPIFFLLLIFAYFLQVPVLKLISGNQLKIMDLHQIQLIFLSIIPWYLFILIEAPYTMVNVISKKSHVLIMVNSSFVIIFTIIMMFTHKNMGIYSIGFSAAIAQFFNFLWHRKFANRTLKEIVQNIPVKN